MAKAKKQEVEVDDGSEFEGQLVKTKAVASTVFGTVATASEVLDLYDILVSCASDDGDPSEVIADMKESWAIAQRTFGKDATATVAFGIFERKFCSDDDED